MQHFQDFEQHGGPLPLSQIQNYSYLSLVVYGLCKTAAHSRAAAQLIATLSSRRLANLPDHVSYLEIEEGFLERWRKALGGTGNLCVGLVWGGNPAHRNDARRSMSLSLLAPLFRMDGVSWYSLQKGEQEKELEDFPVVSGSGCLENLAPKLDSFEDTAAVIDLLDLVISVDTSVAHLAGALARPTWLLLPFDADWRWLLERDDSPWYPTMRLFRQPEPGAWPSVVERVCHRLRAVVSGGERL